MSPEPMVHELRLLSRPLVFHSSRENDVNRLFQKSHVESCLVWVAHEALVNLACSHLSGEGGDDAELFEDESESLTGQEFVLWEKRFELFAFDFLAQFEILELCGKADLRFFL